MSRLAIVTTHPIQYHSPVFRLLESRGNLELKVFYTKKVEQIAFDKGFGKEVIWDIPLLDGYNYSFQPGGSRKLNQGLINAIQNWKPKAILVFGWAFPGHLSVLRYFKGKIPVWFRGDSTLLDEIPGPKKWARRIFLTWVYQHVDHAFYVGSNNQEYYKKHGLSEKQLSFAPHAIDNARFSDSIEKKYEEQANDWRENLGFTKDDFILVYAGKLEIVKNLEILIDAVKRLNLKNELNDKKYIQLILAGSGEMEKDLVHKTKLASCFHFIGFQNQSKMPIVYRLGNAFCLPSQSETWGLSVNEALACGRPVVVSNKVGCAEDLVKGKPFGATFIYSDVESLENAIQSIQRYCNQYEKQNSSDLISSSIANWNFEEICKAFENKMKYGY